MRAGKGISGKVVGIPSKGAREAVAIRGNHYLHPFNENANHDGSGAVEVKCGMYKGVSSWPGLLPRSEANVAACWRRSIIQHLRAVAMPLLKTNHSPVMGISELSSFCAGVRPVCDKTPGELVAKSGEIRKPGLTAAALRAAAPHCALALPDKMP